MKRLIEKFLNELIDKVYNFIESAEETNKPITIIKAMCFIFIAMPILQISYWCWCIYEWCKKHIARIKGITKYNVILMSLDIVGIPMLCVFHALGISQAISIICMLVLMSVWIITLILMRNRMNDWFYDC